MVKKILSQFFKKIENFIFPPLEVEVIKGRGEDVEVFFKEFLKDNFDVITEVKVYFDRVAPILIKGVKHGRKNKVYVLWRNFYKNTEHFKEAIRGHSSNAKIIYV